MLVVIPFYDNLHLVEKHMVHLTEWVGDLRALNAECLIVNDWPEDDGQHKAIEALAEALISFGVPTTILQHEHNLGFVASANRGLILAKQINRDVLLLNSDAFPLEGAIVEMARVAREDDLIGFVSPRTNYGTLASVPFWSEERAVEPERAYEYWQRLTKQGLLPKSYIVPTVPGFCLLVKKQVLETVGIFDEAYSPGYNEENDLILRSNRVGFKAVLANYAFVYHFGNHSFRERRTMLDDANRRRLIERYPEYSGAVAAYYMGIDRTQERLATALAAAHIEGPSIAFDLSMLGSYHNGTFKLAVELCRKFTYLFKAELRVGIIASREALAFHGLDELELDADIYPDHGSIAEPFTVVLRLAQPFDISIHALAHRVAPIVGYMMLDTIALDALYLGSRQPALHASLAFAATYADLLIFISEASRRMFEARFGPNSSQIRVVARPSTAVDEYAPSVDMSAHDAPRLLPSTRARLRVLVIGNHFSHKMVDSTVEVLVREVPDIEVDALGGSRAYPGTVHVYTSGMLTPKQIQTLYAKADVVVFPSNVEGFGFPIVEAIAFRKPLLLRDRQVNCEVVKQLSSGQELATFYRTDTELVAIISELRHRDRLAWRVSPEGPDDVRSRSEVSWEGMAVRVKEAILAAIRAREADSAPLGNRNVAVAAVSSACIELETRLNTCNELRAGLEEQLRAVLDSRSWRVTRPARWVGRGIRKGWGLAKS